MSATSFDVDAEPLSPREVIRSTTDLVCNNICETQSDEHKMEILKSHTFQQLGDVDCTPEKRYEETSDEMLSGLRDTQESSRGNYGAHNSSSQDYANYKEQEQVSLRLPPKLYDSPSQAYADCEEQEQVSLGLPPKPHDDWSFNNLLLEISHCVTQEQLEDFKMLFRGKSPGAIGKKKFEHCTTCMQFFALLTEMDYLGRNNTLYLQKLLSLMKRKDLIAKLIKYCQDNRTLYFFTPEDQTEDGHMVVHLHVKGQDLSRFTPTFVREARETVAAILCIPLENVRIGGLQPANSFIITLIIPDLYAEILQEMLEQGKELVDLSIRNVDSITLNGKTFNTIVTNADSETDTIVTEQGETLERAHKKLQEAKEQFESMKNQRFNLIDSLSDQVSRQNQEIQGLYKELDLLNTLYTMPLSDEHYTEAPTEMQDGLHDVEQKQPDIKSSNRFTVAVSDYARNKKMQFLKYMHKLGFLKESRKMNKVNTSEMEATSERAKIKKDLQETMEQFEPMKRRSSLCYNPVDRLSDQVSRPKQEIKEEIKRFGSGVDKIKTTITEQEQRRNRCRLS